MSRCQRKHTGISAAIKSFMGYLEGTQKSQHTIQNYRYDLERFQEFLATGLGRKAVSLSDITLDDVEKYYASLKAQGLKNNTRRRRILTVRKLLKYLTQRKKVDIDIGRQIPAPYKIERIPKTLPMSEILAAIRALKTKSESDWGVVQQRDLVLLWTLAETGCLVSEVTRIRFEDWDPSGRLEFHGKSQRVMNVSIDLVTEVFRLQKLQVDMGLSSPWLFLGLHRAAAPGAPISPRAVELLVKTYASQLGFDEITPRMFRHSAVLHWHQQGMKRPDIRVRLGLKTDYAFRMYDPLFKSNS